MARTLTSLKITIDQIKAELPITYVLDRYGHHPANRTGSRLHYHSPFREDNNPSLDVFYSEDQIQRWGDFADPDRPGGSVVDLIQHLEGNARLKDVMPKVRALYDDFVQGDWEEELQPTDRLAEIDPEILERELKLGIVGAESKLAHHLVETRPGITLKALQTFEVRDGISYLAAIYPDQRAIRVRDRNDKWFRAGSKTGFYHAPGHGPDDLPKSWPIVMCEGESDTWAAFAAYGRDMVVLGLPGTGQIPKDRYMEWLMGRRVVLGFDADESGRRFSRRWAAELKDAGCTVSVLPLPEGRDLASFPLQSLSEFMERRRFAVVNVTNLHPHPQGYGIDRAEVTDLVSNWTLLVTEVLLTEEDHAYKVRVLTQGETSDDTYTLASTDLESASAMSRWSRKFHGAWWGTTQDVQKLVAELEEQSVYAPTVRTVPRPMLIKPSGFALPGKSIDTDVIVDEENGMLVGEVANMRWPTSSRGASAKTLMRLLTMHSLSVTSPILAWLAMAPLRSLYSEFPQCFVTGAAGSGKTTICSTMVRIMNNVTSVSSLTSTTPHGVTVRIGSTNCLPVWFDEYRPGGRKAAIERLDQMMRDAYNATPSVMGGLTADKTKVAAVATDAPLLISGEDLADEQSHRDRLIRVVVPLRGKGNLPDPHPVDDLLAVEYLQWLSAMGQRGTPSRLMAPPEVDPGPYLDVLNDRQAWNLGILDAGWSLLAEFVDHLSGGEIEWPEADWSAVLSMEEAESGDKILEILRDMHERWGDCQAIWVDKETETIYVSPAQTTHKAKMDGVDMPFRSSKVLREHLVQNCDGEPTPPIRQARIGLHKTRYLKIPLSLWSDDDEE